MWNFCVFEREREREREREIERERERERERNSKKVCGVHALIGRIVKWGNWVQLLL
jgi:hypothetical protein